MKMITLMKNIGFLAKNIPFAAKKAERYLNKAIEVSHEIGAKAMMGQSYLAIWEPCTT